MVSVVLVTHGRLADELLEAATRIVGAPDRVEAVSLGWQDDVVDARRRIESAIKHREGEGPVLVITDMFGGPATDIALSLLDPGKVEVVTGVNLPMMLRLPKGGDESGVGEIARRLAEQSRQGIQVASELLDKARDTEGGSP